MSENDAYYLSLSGSAPNGESFDVTLHYYRDARWSLGHRIDKLAHAANVLASAVLLDDPRDRTPGESAEGDEQEGAA